jgi:HicA toxin of bacterial toxin-antitoxin,
MNRKHISTLKVVFTDPVSPSVRWSDIEALLVAAGAETIEGAGSAMKFSCRGVVASFHRPHPAKEAKRYQVRDAREFLTKIGITP